MKIHVVGVNQLLNRVGHIEEQNEEIIRLLRRGTERDTQMAADINTVKDEIGPLTDAVTGATTLLDSIHQALLDAIANNDPAAFQELADSIDAQKQELADAIVRNTPAGPEPTPEG